MEAVTVEKDTYRAKIEVTIGSEAFEKVARKVAREAIESFLETADDGFCPINAEADGLEFRVDGESVITIPWDNIYLFEREAIEAIEKWLAERKKYVLEEEGDAEAVATASQATDQGAD